MGSLHVAPHIVLSQLLQEVLFKIPVILHFTVVCLVAKPLNRSEATGDLVVIQTMLLFIRKSFCYHAN